MENVATASDVFKILNKKGLHARAAAAFVREAEKFDSDIVVERNGKSASGASIMGLMMLGAAVGEEIRVTCCGDDAVETLNALKRLVNERFYED